MSRKSQKALTPRNGHTLVVGIVARISGCASQKNLSLDDQVDHGKEEIAELYSGPIEYRVIATKGKGEALDRPELAEIELMIRSGELDVLIMEDVGRLVRGTEAVRLWGIAVDHGVRCIAPNDCVDTIDESWEEDLIASCRDHVGHCVWGGNGITKNMMCSASRKWQCWHSIGFDGPLAVQRIVPEITSALYQLEGFDAQYAGLVESAMRDRSGGATQRWRKLERDEAALARERDNLMSAILEYGTRPQFQEKLDDFDGREKKLQRERYELELLKSRELVLPGSVRELRLLMEEHFEQLAVESFDFADLMRSLVPEFHVYLVRLCDGGHLLPRARVKLDLAGSVPDADHVPGLKDMLTRVITVDLFDRPPQRERIREEAVHLEACGFKQREITEKIEEQLTVTAVQYAITLDRKMKAMGLDNPYVLVMEPPEDYAKLRRHKNKKYRFEPREGYERPLL